MRKTVKTLSGDEKDGAITSAHLGRFPRKEMIKRAAEAEMRQLQIEKELEVVRLAEAAKREEER